MGSSRGKHASQNLLLEVSTSATNSLRCLRQDWRRKTWARHWLRNADAYKNMRSLRACGSQALSVMLASLGKQQAADKVAAIQRIDRFHMEQLAYFIERLKSVKEGSGTLLDNTQLLCGSGIGDGNRHNHENLPIVWAGRAGGQVKTGRHVVYPKNTPLCNLYLNMLGMAGAKADRFGDSDGRLTNLG